MAHVQISLNEAKYMLHKQLGLEATYRPDADCLNSIHSIEIYGPVNKDKKVNYINAVQALNNNQCTAIRSIDSIDFVMCGPRYEIKHFGITGEVITPSVVQILESWTLINEP